MLIISKYVVHSYFDTWSALQAFIEILAPRKGSERSSFAVFDNRLCFCDFLIGFYNCSDIVLFFCL